LQGIQSTVGHVPEGKVKFSKGKEKRGFMREGPVRETNYVKGRKAKEGCPCGGN